jgi:hypothetical protein
MRHLLLVLFLLVAGYVFYSMAPTSTRKAVFGFIALHGIRFGVILAIAALVILTALHLPAASIF